MKRILNKVRSLVSLVLVLAFSFSIINVNAATSGNSKNNDSVKSQQVQLNSAAAKLKIDKVSDSEYHFIVTKDGHTTMCIATKTNKSVTSKYYYDNELILNENIDLKKSENFGSIQKTSAPTTKKSEIAVSLSAEATHFTTDGGVHYSGKSASIPYHHPDKGWYGISPYETWAVYGTYNYYEQINYYDSQSILQSPTWAIGSGIGALVGGVASKNLGGSVIGAIIGGAFGGYFGAQIQRIADENGCIWFIIPKSTPIIRMDPWWLSQYAYYISYMQVGPYSVSKYYFRIPNVI